MRILNYFPFTVLFLVIFLIFRVLLRANYFTQSHEKNKLIHSTKMSKFENFHVHMYIILDFVASQSCYFLQYAKNALKNDLWTTC